MALQKSFDDRFGATHASAYHRVARIEMNIARRSAQVHVYTYKDQAARNANKDPVEVTSYLYTQGDYDALFDPSNMSPVDKDPLKNAYDELKTRPEWAGATDV
jgi:hypothetical protein